MQTEIQRSKQQTHKPHILTPFLTYKHHHTSSLADFQTTVSTYMSCTGVTLSMQCPEGYNLQKINYNLQQGELATCLGYKFKFCVCSCMLGCVCV